MTHEELLQASHILGEASRGILTIDDDFRKACRIGQELVTGVVSDEEQVDKIVENLKKAEAKYDTRTRGTTDAHKKKR